MLSSETASSVGAESGVLVRRRKRSGIVGRHGSPEALSLQGRIPHGSKGFFVRLFHAVDRCRRKMRLLLAPNGAARHAPCGFLRRLSGGSPRPAPRGMLRHVGAATSAVTRVPYGLMVGTTPMWVQAVAARPAEDRLVRGTAALQRRGSWARSPCDCPSSAPQRRNRAPPAGPPKTRGRRHRHWHSVLVDPCPRGPAMEERGRSSSPWLEVQSVAHPAIAGVAVVFARGRCRLAWASRFPR